MTKAESIASGPNHEVAGLALGFVAVVIFAATLPLTRIALVNYSPWFISFGRAMIATMAASVLLLVLRRPLPRQHFTLLILAGALLIFGFPCMMAIALQTVPSAHGGVVLGILPLLTAVFAVIIDGDRPSPLFWLCAVIGGLLVTVFSLRGSGLQLSTGDLWLFAACPMASLGYVISGKLTRSLPGWEVISWSLILISPATVALTWLTWPADIAQASPAATASLLYLGLFSMFVGYFAWNIGLALGGIARIGQMQLLQPFVTIALSALLLSEPIGWDMIGFAFAVVAVVAISRRARIKRG